MFVDCFEMIHTGWMLEDSCCVLLPQPRSSLVAQLHKIIRMTCDQYRRCGGKDVNRCGVEGAAERLLTAPVLEKEGNGDPANVHRSVRPADHGTQNRRIRRGGYNAFYPWKTGRYGITWPESVHQD